MNFDQLIGVILITIGMAGFIRLFIFGIYQVVLDYIKQ
jgi:hypothetical protein